MDDNEHEQLDDIHNEVKGSNAQLGRIVERTRNIENNLKCIDDSVQRNKEDIDELQSRVKRNTTVLGGVGAGATAIMLWISDKLTRVIGFA